MPEYGVWGISLFRLNLENEPRFSARELKKGKTGVKSERLGMGDIAYS